VHPEYASDLTHYLTSGDGPLSALAYQLKDDAAGIASL
jgi:hypothetical protein